MLHFEIKHKCKDNFEIIFTWFDTACFHDFLLKNIISKF